MGSLGSGKTHSIMGVAEDPGILPRSLAEFFDCMSDSSLLREEMEDAAAEKEEDPGETQLATMESRSEGPEEGENRVGFLLPLVLLRRLYTRYWKGFALMERCKRLTLK